MSVDKSSVSGISLAVGGIIAGLLLEGGNLGQILQPTAAIIVFGGTIGAVMLQFPLNVVLQAMRRLGSVFLSPKQDPEATILRLVKYAQKARREGIVSLDADLPEIEDPFLHKSLMLAVDGTDQTNCARSWSWNSTTSPNVKSKCRKCSSQPAASRPPLASSALFSV